MEFAYEPARREVECLRETWEEPVVPDAVKQMLEANILADRAWYHFYLKRCESPVEQLMVLALARLGFGRDCYMQVQEVIETETGGTYRVDIALYLGGMKVGIECDGHEFHEKTKEQAKRDRQRERVLLKNGWMLMRFTGSEIYNDPLRCAGDVAEFADYVNHDGFGNKPGSYYEQIVKELDEE